MSTDEFVDIATDKLEKNFPKGECGERGEAIVLIAELALELTNRGVLTK